MDVLIDFLKYLDEEIELKKSPKLLKFCSQKFLATYLKKMLEINYPVLIEDAEKFEKDILSFDLKFPLEKFNAQLWSEILCKIVCDFDNNAKVIADNEDNLMKFQISSPIYQAAYLQNILRCNFPVAIWDGTLDNDTPLLKVEDNIYPEAYFLPLKWFSFSTRVKNIFKADGLEYVGDIACKTRRSFLRCRQFGALSLKELSTCLGYFGLDFSEDDACMPENADELAVKYFPNREAAERKYGKECWQCRAKK